MCSNLNLTPINLRYIVYSWKTLNSQIEPVATDLFEIDKIERQVLLLLKMTTCKKTSRQKYVSCLEKTSQGSDKRYWSTNKQQQQASTR